MQAAAQCPAPLAQRPVAAQPRAAVSPRRFRAPGAALTAPWPRQPPQTRCPPLGPATQHPSAHDQALDRTVSAALLIWASHAPRAAPPAMDSFTIRVKTLAPATHELSVAPTTSVAALKATLAPLAAVPAHRQRLIWRGRVINDSQTLEELGEPRAAERRAPCGPHGRVIAARAAPGSGSARRKRLQRQLPRPRPLNPVSCSPRHPRQASAPMMRCTSLRRPTAPRLRRSRAPLAQLTRWVGGRGLAVCQLPVAA